MPAASVIVELAPVPTGLPFAATSVVGASLTVTVLPIGSASGSCQQTPVGPVTALRTCVEVTPLLALALIVKVKFFPASAPLEGVSTLQIFSAVVTASLTKFTCVSPFVVWLGATTIDAVPLVRLTGPRSPAGNVEMFVTFTFGCNASCTVTLPAATWTGPLQKPTGTGTVVEVLVESVTVNWNVPLTNGSPAPAYLQTSTYPVCAAPTGSFSKLSTFTPGPVVTFTMLPLIFVIFALLAAFVTVVTC